MPDVGDTIQVRIGSQDSGVSFGGPGASISVGRGASMSVSGKIVQDLGDRWLVQLSISVGGRNQIEIPKSNVD